MSRRGIKDLQYSSRYFRMDLDYNGRRSGFETLAKSRAEDLLRARKLRNVARLYPDRIDARAALALADRLERAGNGREEPETLASSVHMRDQRIKVAGAIWKLVRRPGS